ncbi:MAG TPA: hypothetical protein VFF63_08830 [Candidatus Babeliales bacterium]|nr:hypothetical protein [Candidatus Babeliales bacterium]
MNHYRIWIGFSACLIGMQPTTASAYTVTTHHPIQVNNCNPQRNVYSAPAYTPAFYPGWAGPYWGWPSVYGPTYYQYPVEGEPTLAIDYVNVTQAVMRQIEFGLVVRGNLVAEVKDVGTFSPGAEIKHKFGLNPNVFPIQTSFAQCVPLKITFEDGTKWKNPHLPALQRSIYGPPPH